MPQHGKMEAGAPKLLSVWQLIVKMYDNDTSCQNVLSS